MTRQEHLDFCKQRALEYCEAGDIQNAVASMLSDLGKHPETDGHIGGQLGLMLLMSGNMRTVQDARRAHAGDGLMLCDAPNPGTEMRCTREANHSGECSSKYKIFYEHGIVSWGTMTWVGPNNLPKEQQDEPRT